jgi:NitT/TauT family transport system ATP-binding protein
MTIQPPFAAAKGSSAVLPGARDAPPQRVLEVENLRKRFIQSNGRQKEDLEVLDGVSFSMTEGEFVTIVGPSGCGKTTLLNIIAGMEASDWGTVTLNGRRVTSPGTDAVMIFQEDALFPWLTVAENVAFGLRNGGRGEAEREKIAAEYVEMVQLRRFANSHMHQLSGGMKQRVAIARGLVMNPRILLMDEPFGALDHRTREILQVQITSIHEKTRKTILFVTHDVREAVSLGDRVLLLSGRPSRIKREYIVDVPRPRSADDPQVQSIIEGIVDDLKEEVSFEGGFGETLANGED